MYMCVYCPPKEKGSTFKNQNIGKVEFLDFFNFYLKIIRFHNFFSLYT